MKVNVNFATATLFVICIAVGHQNLMHPHLTVHELVVNNVVHNLFMRCSLALIILLLLPTTSTHLERSWGM